MPPGGKPALSRALRLMSLVTTRQPAAFTLKHVPVLWVIRPRSNRKLFCLALELGNLHVPIEFEDDFMLVAPDGPVEEILERMGLTWDIRRL
jgi:urease accessory protein UreE